MSFLTLSLCYLKLYIIWLLVHHSCHITVFAVHTGCSQSAGTLFSTASHVCSSSLKPGV